MALEDYFKHFEDVLTGRDEKDPWPKKEDLQPGRIYIDQKSCLDVQSFLDEHRYCLVEGAERRGKTTLVRFIGLSYLEDWHVWGLDVSRVSGTSDLDDFVRLLKGGVLDRSDTLIIVEDCHMKPEITKKLLSTVEECREARFLFTMRIVKQRGGIPVEEPFEDSKIREQGWVVRLDETKRIIYDNIKGIVVKSLEIRSGSLEHKSGKASPTNDDYNYLVQQTGGNKRILKYYLKAWLNAEDPNPSLRQIDRKLILEQFHKERLKVLTEVQLEVVLIMSVLGQFEVPIVIKPLFPSSVSKLDFDRAADELNTHLRGLAFKLPRGAWLFADTESRLTLECYHERIDNRFVYKILSAYVKEATNYFDVFHALHRAQERPMLVLLAEDAEVRDSLTRRFRDPKIVIGEMLHVLRAIAWVDKTKALELWSEYRKILGEKFFDEVPRKLSETDNIGITMGLLNLLETIDRESEAVPLVNALPAELLVSALHLRTRSFPSLVNRMSKLRILAREKVKQVLKCLDESDYRRCGEEARKHSIFHVMWFLRMLADDENLKPLANHFLNAFGREELIVMGNASSIRTISSLRYYLRALGTDTAKEIEEGLNPDVSENEWIERLTKETVRRQSSLLWIWVHSRRPDLRKRGRELVRRLANADIALHFGKDDAVAAVHKLSLLLFCAYYLDEEAAKGLAVKAMQIFNPVPMVYSLEHLVFLLNNSRCCNPDVDQQLVEKIFSIDASSLLSKGDLHWFCRLLWQAALSNKPRTKDWVAEVTETFWEDLAVNTPPSNTFYLLLALWQANEELGRSVADAVGRKLLTSPELVDDLQVMPLLGFFVFCGLEPQVALSFPPEGNIDKLCIYPSTQRLVCSLFYLQQSRPDMTPRFIKAVLALKGMTARTGLLLARYPLPWTTLSLADILAPAKNESWRQREDVYDRMLLLWRTIRQRLIYLGTLYNAMCVPWFARERELTLEAESVEREEERTRSWATVRLNKAIDKGIFIVQETEHPITHKASRLLSLNWGHPEVAFAFDITRHLLLGLRDAQRDKEWADYETWKTAFGRSWNGEPLPLQQLCYWQEILLKMNLVKVDYQKIDESQWVIAFWVNSEHPLAKSLIVKS
jgi:hypothetical protein